MVAVPRASLCSGFSFCRAQASANPKLSIQPSPAPLPLDSSVQFSHSVVPDSLQLMDCSITNPEPAQTHVHQVGDAIQPSYLRSSRPFLLLFQSFPALGQVKVKCLSRIGLLATPWTAAYQAPLTSGFSRPGYWSVLPLPSPTIQCKTLFIQSI